MEHLRPSRWHRPGASNRFASALGVGSSARYPRPRVDARGRGSTSVRHALGCAPTRGARGRESTLEAEEVRQFGRRVGGGAPTRGNKRSVIMGRLGLPELLVILAIVIIIFGANRLPEIGRGIGSAIRNFKN